jgi:hypothetical protein
LVGKTKKASVGILQLIKENKIRQTYFSTHTKPTISVAFEKPKVFLDDGSPAVWKKFHCHVCGKPAFEYQTKAKIIIAGDAGREAEAVDRVQCKGCKTLFIIS